MEAVQDELSILDSQIEMNCHFKHKKADYFASILLYKTWVAIITLQSLIKVFIF